MASSTIIFALVISLVAAHENPIDLLTDYVKVQEMHNPYRIVGGKVQLVNLADKLEEAQIPRNVVEWYLQNSKDKSTETRMTDLEDMAEQMQEKKGWTVPKGGNPLTKFLQENDVRPTTDAFKKAVLAKDENEKDPAIADKDDMMLSETVDDAKTSGVKGVTDKESEDGYKHLEPKETKDKSPSVADESVAAAPSATAGSTSTTVAEETGGWDIVFWCLLTTVILVAGWWAYKMKLHDRLATIIAEATFAMKQWFSKLLKGGKSSDTPQADGMSSTSESSLGSDNKSGTTSQSSGMGGLNTHLQGVIDRVRKNFQDDTPGEQYGKLDESDAAAAQEGGLAPKPKPKTGTSGYQRGSKSSQK